MATNLRNIDLVKALRLKPVGIALAGIWLIVLVAAVAGTIYREIDGPSLRSSLAANRDLKTLNSTLNGQVNSARGETQAANGTIDQLEADLIVLQTDITALKRRLESYFSSAPLAQTEPYPPAALDIPLFP